MGMRDFSYFCIPNTVYENFCQPFSLLNLDFLPGGREAPERTIPPMAGRTPLGGKYGDILSTPRLGEEPKKRRPRWILGLLSLSRAFPG
jgi:hypothetical protein